MNNIVVVTFAIMEIIKLKGEEEVYKLRSEENEDRRGSIYRERGLEMLHAYVKPNGQLEGSSNYIVKIGSFALLLFLNVIDTNTRKLAIITLTIDEKLTGKGLWMNFLFIFGQSEMAWAKDFIPNILPLGMDMI